MKNVMIIQARMGSTRLPGKVMMKIGDGTMLDRVVKRASRATMVDQVVVATTALPSDDIVADHAASLGATVFRGDEEDVLSRYYLAATSADAGMVTRVTADCPLIEPTIIDKVATAFLEASPQIDFAANTLRRTYPQGLDVEVAAMHTLQRAWREARNPYERVHVFPYVYENPDRFALMNVADEADNSQLRWTVDTNEDLTLIRAIYEEFDNRDDFTWHDVLALLMRKPKLKEINHGIRQKELAEG